MLFTWEGCKIHFSKPIGPHCPKTEKWFFSWSVFGRLKNHQKWDFGSILETQIHQKSTFFGICFSMFFWMAFLMDSRGFWSSFRRVLGGQMKPKRDKAEIWKTYVFLKKKWCFQGFRPSKQGWKSIKNRIRKKHAFRDDFLRFLAPFWEAFGSPNLEKRLSEIRWKMHAIFGVLLGLNPAARRNARSVWGTIFRHF